MKSDVFETLRIGHVNVPQRDRKEQVLEISAFLFLIVPSMALSFFAINQGSLSFSLSVVAAILRDLSLVSLILFFLWHNRGPVRSIGWNLTNFWKEFGLGVILFFPFFYISGQLENTLHALGLSLPSTAPAFLSPKGAVEIMLALLLVVVVAIAEETIFRGYLILRFKAIMDNPAAVSDKAQVERHLPMCNSAFAAARALVATHAGFDKSGKVIEVAAAKKAVKNLAFYLHQHTGAVKNLREHI